MGTCRQISCGTWGCRSSGRCRRQGRGWVRRWTGQTTRLLARLLGDGDALRVGDAVADLSREVLALLARHNGATSSGTLLHLPAPLRLDKSRQNLAHLAVLGVVLVGVLVPALLVVLQLVGGVALDVELFQALLVMLGVALVSVLVPALLVVQGVALLHNGG